jgi:catalase-peroxidase
MSACPPGLFVACAIAPALLLLPAYADVPQRAPRTASFWRPDHLDLFSLRQHDENSNPLGTEFDYTKFELNGVKADVGPLLTTSKD